MSKSKQKTVLAAKALAAVGPLLLFFGVPYLVLWQGGELTSLGEVVEMQAAGHPVRYAPAYSDPSIPYKLLATKKQKPRVLALGTSRVLQFRSGFFKRPEQFYNAGRAVRDISHYQPFLEKIPNGQQPKVIILGLDQWNFLEEFKLGKVSLSEVNVSPEQLLRDRSTAIYADCYQGKFSLSDLLDFRKKETRIGISALATDSGFRRDGSYKYGVQSEDAKSGYSKTVAAVNRGYPFFSTSKPIARERLQILDAFLRYCDDNKIYVCVFLPPYTSVVYRAIEKKHLPESYLTELPTLLKPLVESRGFAFFDFSDPASFGGNDLEAIDGFHGSEKAYLRMLAKMAEDCPEIRRVSGEPTSLGQLLSNSASDTDVFAD